MNKKFSTLMAVLLTAGAWTTLDAEVKEEHRGLFRIFLQPLQSAQIGQMLYLEMFELYIKTVSVGTSSHKADLYRRIIL